MKRSPAGIRVILTGRFWVIAEAQGQTLQWNTLHIRVGLDPFVCFLVGIPYSCRIELGIQKLECFLAMRKAKMTREELPRVPLYFVYSHSDSLRIGDSHVIRSHLMALLGSFQVPPNALGEILFHALPIGIENA